VTGVEADQDEPRYIVEIFSSRTCSAAQKLAWLIELFFGASISLAFCGIVEQIAAGQQILVFEPCNGCFEDFYFTATWHGGKGIYSSYARFTWSWWRNSRRPSTMRPTRAYETTFDAITQYHLTPKWKAMLMGTIGQVNRASTNKTGCGDIGTPRLRITQAAETTKPSSAHSSIPLFIPQS
jgi:hypothetical protein